MSMGVLMLSIVIIALMFNNLDIVMEVVLLLVNLFMLGIGVAMFYFLITWFMS